MRRAHHCLMRTKSGGHAEPVIGPRVLREPVGFAHPTHIEEGYCTTAAERPTAAGGRGTPGGPGVNCRGGGAV
jgi:hypothetical protein